MGLHGLLQGYLYLFFYLLYGCNEDTRVKSVMIISLGARSQIVSAISGVDTTSCTTNLLAY
jgi:hypothetical protein